MTKGKGLKQAMSVHISTMALTARTVVRITCLLLLLGMLMATAAAVPIDNPRELGYARLKFTYSAAMTATPKSTDARLSELTVHVFRVPQEDARQRIVSLDVDTPGKLDNDALGNRFATFTWKEVAPEGTYPLKITSEVEVRARQVPVRDPPPFPLPPDDVTGHRDFLNPGQFTTYDPEMAAIAFEVTRDATDALDAAILLAIWVHDYVTYDPICGDTIRGAAWTFENKRGTCDEITHLYMSLCRAVGLPVRYVSGYAFGTFEESDDWGPHAWAEVFLPGTGWVPMDPTYNEIGWLDPTHLKISVSTDGNTTSERHTVRFVEVELAKSAPAISIEVLDAADATPPMTLSLDAPDELGANDPVLIRAHVKNLRDTVLVTSLKLGYRTEKGEFHLIWGREEQSLRLEPREEAELHWMLQAPDLTLECTTDGTGRRFCTYYQYDFAVHSDVTANVSVRFVSNHERTAGLKVDLPKDRYGVGEEVRAALSVDEPTTVYVITDVTKLDTSRFTVDGASALTFPADRSGTLLIYAADGTLVNHTIHVSQDGAIAADAVSFPEHVTKGETIPVSIALRNSGSRDASRFAVRVSSQNLVLAERVVDALSPGASTEIMLEVPSTTLEVGEHVLTLEVGGENPTQYFGHVRIEGAPALAMSAKLPARMVAGRRYRSVLTLTNTGTAPATGLAFNVILPSGLVFSGFPYPPTLNPGEVHSRAVELVPGYDMSAGNHTLALELVHGGSTTRRDFSFEVENGPALQFLALLDSIYKLFVG